MRIIESDILVIGSGIAGLFFASKSADSGTINIITKAAIDDGNTRLAQGGIACVNNAHDNFESHINDTLLAGAGFCNREAVELMVSLAPALIEELVNIGVKFSKENNILDLGKEGGHSHHRIVHSTDITGSVIEQALVKNVSQFKSIHTFEYFIAIKLVVHDSCCYGTLALDTQTGESVFFRSKSTVLATGGGGQAYLQTTNPLLATGDGYALAYDARVPISDMEFVQFHPTMLHHAQAHGFLISEALRGAGAELVLPDASTFMQHYHPLGSLAPRDIVSRAMYTEMKVLGLPNLFLDARSISPKTIETHFPNINTTCLALGIDMLHHLIPVAPAAHFICGGVTTNLDGCTGLKQLYAIGEVARTGVHGANRLASNSLLEGLVFAFQTANHVKENLPYYKNSVLLPNFPVQKLPKTALEQKEIAHLRLAIQTLMWEHIGIVRCELGMKEGETALNLIGSRIQVLLKTIRLDRELIELNSIYKTAELIINAALKRTVSLGCHYIEYPNTYKNSGPPRDKNILKETVKVKELTQQIVDSEEIGNDHVIKIK
ncbi:MAG: L-aspartate oxidase [Bacteroidetes bacterium]|nr:L-aspartate oxidase [Bacteroidota bacterium]